MKTKVSLLFAFALLGGCASIPEADIAFLDRKISVGMPVEQALPRIERRGFAPIKIVSHPRFAFDEKTKSFFEVPLTFEQIVDSNIGFVRLKGRPDGRLSCFARDYVRLFAAGHRLICWTTDDAGEITWRQAGWRGASL